MRSTIKLALTVFAAAAVALTSCKKGNDASSSDNLPEVDMDATVAAKQIAQAFYSSLNGQYGGAKAADGIKAPNSSRPTRGPRVNSIEPYCGFTIDTTDNFDYTAGDTLKNVDSKYKFIYTCSVSVLDGYVLSDSVTYTDKGTLFLNKYLIAQNYTVNKAANDYSVVNMRGTLGNNFVEKALNSTGAVTDTKNNHTEYVLNNIHISTSNTGTGAVLSGTVSFNATLSEKITGVKTIHGTFKGNMTFLGNNLVNIKLTYKGKTTTQKYYLDPYSGYLSEVYD